MTEGFPSNSDIADTFMIEISLLFIVLYAASFHLRLLFCDLLMRQLCICVINLDVLLSAALVALRAFKVGTDFFSEILVTGNLIKFFCSNYE